MSNLSRSYTMHEQRQNHDARSSASGTAKPGAITFF
jgi:hypothetical protein